MPHRPEPDTYAALIAEARRVQKEGLVVVTSGDWDYREIVLNWVLHAHRLQYSHALVIAMDEELYADLRRRRIPSPSPRPRPGPGPGPGLARALALELYADLRPSPEP